MPLVADIVEKRADRGQLPGARGGIQAFVRNFTMLVLDAFTAEIRQVAVNVRQSDPGNKRQINVADVNLIQALAAQRRVAELLQIAKEISHVQIVFVHGALRVRLDGFVVAEEIQ